ncbi:hypothetical protein JCM10207_008114, partial [Rhodosporidiobolus poonsookiae]
ACATFQNSNSLPIALLQSLIGEKLPLAWGPHDTKDAMLGRGLSYLGASGSACSSSPSPRAAAEEMVEETLTLAPGGDETVLFSSLGIIVRWSIGVRLLTSAESEQEPDAPPSSSSLPADVEAGASASAGASNGDSETLADEEDDEAEEEGEEEGEGEEAALLGKKKGTASILKKPSTTFSTSTTPSNGRSRTTSASGTGNGSRLVVLPNDDLPPPPPGSGFGGPLSSALSDPSSPESRQLRKTRGRIFQSFPNTPIPSVYGGDGTSRATSEAGWEDGEDGEGEWSEGDEDDAEWGARRGVGRRSLGRSRAWRWTSQKARRAWRRIKKVARAVGDFMTVPLWAALLSLFVACVPPLQGVLNQAEPLKAAIRSAGACSVPITLVTLGAYFYRPSSSSPAASAATSNLRPADQPGALNPSVPHPAPPPQEPATSFSASLLKRLRNPFAPLPLRASLPRPRGSGRGETRTVAVAVVARMVLVPLALIPLFAFYAAKTVNVADDPVFVVVACLLIGSPSAITLAQVASSTASPVFEVLISRTLFISYAVMTAPTTILLVLAALWIDKLQHPEKALVDGALVFLGRR